MKPKWARLKRCQERVQTFGALLMPSKSENVAPRALHIHHALYSIPAGIVRHIYIYNAEGVGVGIE